jgi:CheY-like chemotaxis protein
VVKPSAAPWGPAAAERPDVPPADLAPASLLILIAEDDPAIQVTLGAFLHSAGHRVIPAQNGNEAAALLGTAPIDLVVTDILMPGKDGLEFIQEVHQRRPDLPIVAMSGGGNVLGGAFCLRLAKSFGATVAIAKPFSGDQILAAIGAARAWRPQL